MRRWNLPTWAVVYLTCQPNSSPSHRLRRRRSTGSSGPGWSGLGRLLTGSQQLGEDLAQEAFLGLMRAGHAVDAPSAYLRRSLVNLSINAGRRARREQQHLARSRIETVAPPDTDDLWPLIVALPVRQRTVLVLRYYEDMSEAQIADVLGCRPGTVKSLASRALTRLREDIQQ